MPGMTILLTRFIFFMVCQRDWFFPRCFEGAIAACAAPMVGVLAQKLFGFKGEASPTGDRQSDLLKAQAIGNALLCFMAIPWSLCLVAYTGKAFKPCHLILPLLFQRERDGKHSKLFIPSES